MSDLDVVRHAAGDGSVYAVEVVALWRDDYGAQYGVDLVRASTDRYGLEHEQRLRLGAYSSWGSAEEHQREVETALEKDGLDGLGEDARRVAHMPYLDGQYLAMVFPTDGSTGDNAKVHLFYLTGEQVTAALVADGRTEDMENLCGQLDRAWAEGGNERLLDTAQREAELRGQVAPGTPLFDAVPNANLPDELPFTFDERMQPFDSQGIGHLSHVDGGGTAHWFAVVEKKVPEVEPYELRYFRALETSDGALKHDSYPVMPLPDDDPARRGRCRGWKCIWRREICTWRSSLLTMSPTITGRRSLIRWIYPRSTRSRNTTSATVLGRRTRHPWKRSKPGWTAANGVSIPSPSLNTACGMKRRPMNAS